MILAIWCQFELLKLFLGKSTRDMRLANVKHFLHKFGSVRRNLARNGVDEHRLKSDYDTSFIDQLKDILWVKQIFHILDGQLLPAGALVGHEHFNVK